MPKALARSDRSTLFRTGLRLRQSTMSVSVYPGMTGSTARCALVRKASRSTRRMALRRTAVR